MRSTLIWLVRLCSLAAWVAAAVACMWLLGATAMARPWREPFVWGAVAMGCAVVRVVALWVLRGAPKADEFTDELWVKLRTGALWAIAAFSSALFAVVLLTSSNAGGELDDLRDAGATVSTATVVERQSTRQELSDGVVKGYVSRLLVSVPGGAQRLAVRGAYTYEKPGEGAEVDVLWARSDPGLGGYINESKDLATLAENRWNAFQDDESGAGSLIAFIVVALIGVALTSLFTLLPDADDLQEVAWSAPFQTVRTALATLVFWGWSPMMLGMQPSVPQVIVAVGSSCLVLLGYVLTSLRGFG
ncbi:MULTISPECIES: hypothetical protein [Streptomyces]|uniref:Uncharacterized protein n=1 Tax=Streptomyces koelreuteriae TaxID=2838015 RepID=A0ABX8G1F8_9ACTN|nr:MULTISPECIES: hypothetical protein [Streptomyces]QWB27355.1 hypothetical protein KJK29_34760 [Streptomyces koelreuteriae]UUA10439.1 hypothetical protein NNW98_34955 [Streptomyces koelreuteriae]UUA18046.1 hypothetical protein NNW99_34840 [Streptomyces sp. CRCS-T-1]